MLGVDVGVRVRVSVGPRSGVDVSVDDGVFATAEINIVGVGVFRLETDVAEEDVSGATVKVGRGVLVTVGVGTQTGHPSAACVAISEILVTSITRYLFWMRICSVRID
jgi:hypothetical protein